MQIDAATLSAILLAIVGGGGIVPFVWRAWAKRHPRPADEAKAKAEIEAISTHAATETINAMKGAMQVLRQQLMDGKEENDQLRETIEDNGRKIASLEQRVERLIAEIVRLGGDPATLTA
jgi:predicted RNase H-like nuclease (RuvC/YqgF family)